MPRQVYSFDPPERFVAGTVGQPGERTFFLQARGGGAVVSVALEKVQVSVLAERLGDLLDRVLRARGESSGESEEIEDVAPLDAPIFEEFRVGTMRLSWEGEDSRIVIEALAQTGDEPSEPPDDDDDDENGPDVLRVRITTAAARAFVRRAQRVVAAGRPPCPLCGLPLDAEGHVCPRQNGHRA
ncbi:MAG: DUF3090 family protein [Frankia sp.]|nr:DUF3090 family protein [Frankia sp.]